MSYEHPGGESLDYQVCRYGKSRLLVRGPKVRLDAPYTVFFGGTETYGRYVIDPFTLRLSATTGLRCVNISCINAGLDAFAEDPALLAIAAAADTTVVQVLGAANLSNPFYTVHPRRNDRFVAATPALSSLYPDVDFTEFSFTRHLLSSLEQRCTKRFATVVEALQDQWRIQMNRLISEAGPNCILLWIAARRPPTNAGNIRDAVDPLFVEKRMVDEMRTKVEHVIEAVPSDASRLSGTTGMIFTDFEAHIAEQSLNAEAHKEIAAALRPPLLSGQRAA